MYVTDQFTRFCVHLVQCNGKRQIILSTYSKEILEDWLIVIKQSVNMQHSLVLGESHSIEPPPNVVTSPEENQKSFALPKIRFFPEEVSNEFIEKVNEKRAFARMCFDESGERIQIVSDNQNDNKNNKPNTNPVPRSQQQSSQPTATKLQPSTSSTTTKATNDSDLPFSFASITGSSMAPPSPYDVQSSKAETSSKPIQQVQRNEQNRGGSALYDPGSSYIPPQPIIAFQTKFNLPPSEVPQQCN